MSKLIFRYATMGSGKSTEILQINHNYKVNGVNGVLLIPQMDTCSNGTIKSRLGISEQAITFSKDTNLFEIIKNIKDDVNYVIVDEANFLTYEQVHQLSCIVDDLNITVMAYGLLTNFKTELFEGSKRLIEIADIVEKITIKSICKCGKVAIFNARFQNGEISINGNEILIDPKDNSSEVKYIPLCRKCFKSLFLKNK